MPRKTIDPEEWRDTATWTSYRGHSQLYRDDGDGPLLLVIHGFPTSSWDFAPIWEGLTSRFRVVAPDLLGFGFSDKPLDHDYSIVDAADQCVALLSDLDVGGVHLLAHDYGDSVAQELLARHRDGTLPWPVHSCVFLNGGLFPEQHRPRPIQRLLLSPLGSTIAKLMTFDRFAKSFSAVFGPSTKPTEGELRAYWEIISFNEGQRLAHALMRYIPERRRHRQRWVSVILNPDVPIRLIDGVEDPVSGGHVCDHWKAMRPHADIVRLPGIGHYPQVEAPEQVLEAFLAFHQMIDTA